MYIRAACGQLPTSGGFIDFLGLSGTIANQVVCSTPNKQVIMWEDPSSALRITETDGKITFPLDNNSMLLGPGAGQCQISGANPHGIYLDPTANVTSIVGPAHVDGTQEDLTVKGACLWGYTGATVAKGIIYANNVFTNTTFDDNNVEVCNTACIWLENVGGSISVRNNELNVTAGANSVLGSGLVLKGTGISGCAISNVFAFGNNTEHANGSGQNEIRVIGDGAGALACNIHVDKDYVERNNNAGIPDTVGIQVTDCLNCSISGVQFGGTSGGSDAINVAQTANNRTQNVVLEKLFDGGTYTNTINDTTPNAPPPLNAGANPYITNYVAVPGYQQPPVLPPTTIDAIEADLFSGQGNFATGSGTYGTNWTSTGCNVTITCTYTRTNATAPSGVGLSYSQEVQVTVNGDLIGGDNGIQYVPTVAFVAGQPYQVSFWMKGDSVFVPQFFLSNTGTGITICSWQGTQPLTSTWTLYQTTCTPSTSGSTYVQFTTSPQPVLSTGTFYIAGVNFAPIYPLASGSLVTASAPYGLSTAGTSANFGTINISTGTGAPTSTCGTAPIGSGSLWLRTDGSTSTTLYVCIGTSWVGK